MSHASLNGSPAAQPQLKVDTYRMSDALVCRITGDLYLETVPAAEAALEQAAAQFPFLLCVDLHQVRLLDATGLGLLLRLNQRMPLAVIDPSAQAARVLALSDCDLELQICASVEDALTTAHRPGRPE